MLLLASYVEKINFEASLSDTHDEKMTAHLKNTKKTLKVARHQLRM